MKASLSLAISVALAAFATDASAQASIGPQLESLLDSEGPHQVIVTFSDTTQTSRIAEITTSYQRLEVLPMAGAILTRSQIEEVARWDGVESIYFNAPLKYRNFEAGQITGGHLVHDTLGIKGSGVTVAVIDSGIDATHPDLSFGTTTIQNVKLIGDLGLAGVAATLENQPNTDTSSGHGTHVAGTVAGTGAASAGDSRRPFYYAGIAPEANLIGLGAGEGLNIFFALQGFDWVLANHEQYGIDIVTNSWGSSNSVFDPNHPINRASHETYRRGMVVAFAAGNDGPAEDTINPYAVVPWTISVGSGTKSRHLSDFSSRGVAGDPYKHIDVVAPGSDICSTRAPGTIIGALGPVLDLSNPSYTLYYHCISGTSMATPFVAGTSALLLEVNPELSPDQIKRILMESADPMPGLAFHQVGGGYINVAAAIELAAATEGEKQAFRSGVTDWSSQGIWETHPEDDDLIALEGARWQTVNNAAATDGTYARASVSKRETPRARLAFSGRALQLVYPRNSQGGLADVYVNDVFRGRISFFSETHENNGRFGINDLPRGIHQVELRGVQGRIYLDGVLTDGPLLPAETSIETDTTTYTGTIGPSAENLQVDEITFEVDTSTTTIEAALSWDGVADLDFYLIDPEGNEVASAATLENPERLTFEVKIPGRYTYQVTGYASVLTNYQVVSALTRAIQPE